VGSGSSSSDTASGSSSQTLSHTWWVGPKGGKWHKSANV
jgi:hypothetical protein